MMLTADARFQLRYHGNKIWNIYSQLWDAKLLITQKWSKKDAKIAFLGDRWKATLMQIVSFPSNHNTLYCLVCACVYLWWCGIWATSGQKWNRMEKHTAACRPLSWETNICRNRVKEGKYREPCHCDSILQIYHIWPVKVMNIKSQLQ